MPNQVKRWMSPVPGFCETCGGPIAKVFYDAKTNRGPWACMCTTCQKNGPGLNKLGLGFGQEYTQSLITGQWLKTGG